MLGREKALYIEHCKANCISHTDSKGKKGGLGIETLRARRVIGKVECAGRKDAACIIHRVSELWETTT